MSTYSRNWKEFRAKASETNHANTRAQRSMRNRKVKVTLPSIGESYTETAQIEPAALERAMKVKRK